ncbi:unnamed protein product, partial [Phaeothamnion confervicola]
AGPGAHAAAGRPQRRAGEAGKSTNRPAGCGRISLLKDCSPLPKRGPNVVHRGSCVGALDDGRRADGQRQGSERTAAGSGWDGRQVDCTWQKILSQASKKLKRICRW